MSTRAHIRIQKGNRAILLYHHFDGYPEGVGADLRDYLSKNFPGRWYDEEIANSLVKQLHDLKDDGYEITTCIHGDEEFLYVIDCDSRKVLCYPHGWDDSYNETVLKYSPRIMLDMDKLEKE